MTGYGVGSVSLEKVVNIVSKTDILLVILFNVCEFYLIYLFGTYIVKIDIEYILTIFLVFFMVRAKSGKAMHYKKWYLCAIWSFIVFASLFYVFNESIGVSLIMTIFASLNSTGSANITDGFMWKKDSNYILLDEFLIDNKNDPRIIIYKNYLKNHDELMYILFIERFIKNATWQKIKEASRIEDSKKIQSKFDIMYHHLEIELKLKDYK